MRTSGTAPGSSRPYSTDIGNDTRGVGFAAQQAPKAFRGIGTARKAASDPDDGQRLVAAVFSEHGHLLPSQPARIAGTWSTRLKGR